MLDDLSLDKRGLHRRLTGGLKRVNNKRVYTPTAIFTHWDTATDTTTSAPAQPTTSEHSLLTELIGNPVLPGDTNTITTSSSVLSISIPGVVLPTTTSAAPTTSTSVITTSSSITPTTTSTTPPPTTTTPSTTSTSTSVSVARTPLQDATTEVRVTVTSTPSQSQSATSLAASPTSSTTPSSGVSTGAVVGGIVAAVIAVAGIVFAIIYFVRRNRQSSGDDDGADFDPDAFRRQSMMLPDDGASGMARAMTYSRGGARPPTMIEHKLANAPLSYNAPPMPGHPYGYNSYNTFGPGQIMTPTTVNSANPFFSQYSESPMASPVTSVPAYDSAYDAQGNPISRHPSVASTAILSRHTSASSNKPLPDPAGDAQYVDMSRSSVTPFQAQQYAEISRRLNTTPPEPLPLSAVAEEVEHGQEVTMPAPVARAVEPLELQPQISFDEGQRLTVQPTPRENSFPESPFADPNMVSEQSQHIPKRDSADSILQAPAPSFAAKERERITSIPPTLPDIQIEQRPFSPVTLDFPVAPSSVHATPSPFSTSFAIPSPPPSAHFPENQNQNRAPSPVTVAESASAPVSRMPAAAPAAKRPDTVYTLYDEEDAYGGI
ncbi:hypothetical protein L226DRAFT_466008 [Lentinus tigrinus ALCF2SS1-7]|uniref:Uncharacterized protein n=1 Tax=Lentinus tigrinus ALCF2SS1-6 TaxID=1328759 RepID=A0A5C2S1D2_9APHY|nr:hypothetical protein L227DRAFT_507073 [Lentinus tigrinus ALCF2SS1-6]RPD73108.1 hypothetical protein L226DRAFT_466008 [Lentinus tigrinus ALCF2SS1-7]